MNAPSPMETEAPPRAVHVSKPDPETRAVLLTEAEFDQIDNGIGNAQQLISNAGQAFDYLATSISCGHLSGDDASLGVLLRMAARALKAAEKEEIAALELVEMKLRVAQLRTNGGVVKCT